MTVIRHISVTYLCHINISSSSFSPLRLRVPRKGEEPCRVRRAFSVDGAGQAQSQGVEAVDAGNSQRRRCGQRLDQTGVVAADQNRRRRGQRLHRREEGHGYRHVDQMQSRTHRHQRSQGRRGHVLQGSREKKHFPTARYIYRAVLKKCPGERHIVEPRGFFYLKEQIF